jgi:hypothetical protein
MSEDEKVEVEVGTTEGGDVQVNPPEVGGDDPGVAPDGAEPPEDQGDADADGDGEDAQ